MTDGVVDDSGRTIQSVEIAFAVIDALQETGSAGVTELAELLDHSKSTIHSHLRTLEAQRIVVRDGDGYRLSLRILDMATHVRDQVGNYDVIREEVDALAAETGEVAQFGIEEHGQLSYLYKQAGERAVETASRVGTQQPMYATALGKTILASLPDDRACEIIQAQRFEAQTPTTITSAEALAAELDTIRERGYGIDDEENIEGLRCVAAPVTSDETVLGAVSVTGPASRVTHDRIHDELAEEARRAANVIELNTKFAKLGGSGRRK
ncbi:transcriptional regulator, IclR family [Halomicrobium zhouii]|uniref:Transcriptional regulator, IclR family n=1 Tax=Halomicrobium zhouii TaxID=767519 RepID=A0A1I6KJY1_9EURY|nr:IclR family transcriptional regulator [Halomicrobium zhouii]SFR91180.1 transcriptional regulator, IclR family [Halomicrobium zhouii]